MSKVVADIVRNFDRYAYIKDAKFNVNKSMRALQKQSKQSSVLAWSLRCESREVGWNVVEARSIRLSVEEQYGTGSVPLY